MKIEIQKYAIIPSNVVDHIFSLLNKKYSTLQSLSRRGLVKTHICELCKCKSQKKSVNHSKSGIIFDKLGYFSSVWIVCLK